MSCSWTTLPNTMTVPRASFEAVTLPNGDIIVAGERFACVITMITCEARSCLITS